ncbi:MAG: dihydroorotase family protein [Candidatus Tectomicrobia bacterium]|nr:dihydroorotase family protein [Candidatus Tectomicrobia bacterium]
MKADLNIVGGTLVLPGAGLLRAGISIRKGKIFSVALEEALPDARETLEAAGLHVFPGIIDPHVHLGFSGSFANDCRTETLSALAAGTTTLSALLREPGSYLKLFPDFLRDAEANVHTDIVFSLKLGDEGQAAEIPRYVDRLGVTAFKMYQYGLPGMIQSDDDGLMLLALRTLAKLGEPTFLAVHCEDESIVVRATERVRRERKEGTLADWADTHPDVAEEAGVLRAAYLSEVTGGRVYVVHLSTARAARRLREIRRRNPNLLVETTSPNLSITRDSSKGFLAKMSPAFHGPQDVEALWEALRDGVIDTLGTDHTPRRRSEKNLEGGLWGSRTGIAAVGTHLPVLLHEGHHKRGIPLVRIAEAASRNPARIFGIYPQKGDIRAGSDADLVLVDLEAERKVRPEDLHSFAGFSLYEGEILKGWPEVVVKGGKVAIRDGEVLSEPGSGRYLRRKLACGRRAEEVMKK